MTSYHNILSKNDRALMAYLVARGAGTFADVFPAKRSLNKELPCTVCWSEKGAPIRNTGNYTLATSIMVKTAAPVDAGVDPGQPRLDSDARIRATFDAFFTMDTGGTDFDSTVVAAQVTASARALAIADPANHADLADYTCLDVRDMGPEAAFSENGDAWVDTLNLEVDCCPSNVD